MGEKIDFASAREQMVLKQLKGRDITGQRVLKVMGKIPREEFLPFDVRNGAYLDGPLVIGQGQTISQPYIVALMTQLLDLKGSERVLEIGTGSGYQAAVLSKLAKQIYTIERHPSLSQKAQKVFNKLKYQNIWTKVGDGSKGWLEKAPFDRIIVTAAVEKVPLALINQLADGGTIVAPIGMRHYQELIRITKNGEGLKKENFGGCIFVPLIAD